jgi:hypothetical protein
METLPPEIIKGILFNLIGGDLFQFLASSTSYKNYFYDDKSEIEFWKPYSNQKLSRTNLKLINNSWRMTARSAFSTVLRGMSKNPENAIARALSRYKNCSECELNYFLTYF